MVLLLAELKDTTHKPPFTLTGVGSEPQQLAVTVERISFSR